MQLPTVLGCNSCAARATESAPASLILLSLLCRPVKKRCWPQAGQCWLPDLMLNTAYSVSRFIDSHADMTAGKHPDSVVRACLKRQLRAAPEPVALLQRLPSFTQVHYSPRFHLRCNLIRGETKWL